MTVQFRSDISAMPQFWELFLTTGWNDKYQLSPDDLIQGLRASWYTLSAYDGEHLVGFGRILSDGVLHAMIYELIVEPEYQNQGIGGQILERLVLRCRQAGIRDIQLFCARGKRSFYERRGFIARPEDAPGMQYQPDSDSQ